MSNKFFILNADDFGLSFANNQAILEGYTNGFLTSASLCANTDGFENAVHDIIPDCPNLSIAAHLNIMEGHALTDCPLLTDNNGVFNKGYLYLLLNRKNSELLAQIEGEFRAQIEKIRQNVTIDHLDSHVHTHAIPEIFEITCKLAKEYNINFVRTQYEEAYFVPKLKKHLNIKYLINHLKIALLQHFTKINRKTISNYDLKTNDYIIGVGYTGMMDSETIEHGLKALEEDCIAEALIHPKKYSRNKKDSHTKEFAITLDMMLKDTISRMGFDITNYKNLNK